MSRILDVSLVPRAGSHIDLCGPSLRSGAPVSERGHAEFATPRLRTSAFSSQSLNHVCANRRGHYREGETAVPPRWHALEQPRSPKSDGGSEPDSADG